MRKIIYFNKENAKLLDELTHDKLDDFSNYVCNLIRKDIKNEEMKIITLDLEEIKHKLDMIQESVKSGIVISSNPVEEIEEQTTNEDDDDPLDVDRVLNFDDMSL